MHLTGDFRFEAHNIDADMPDYFDGMALQNLVVNTMFYFMRNFDGNDPMTGFPPNVQAIGDEVMNNYADYLYFTNNLTFDQLKQFMGGFDAQSQMMLMGMLLPGTYTPG